MESASSSPHRSTVDCPFLALSDEASVHHVPYVDIHSTTPLQFYREHVAQSRPAILTGALGGWPAVERWTNAYLRERIGHLLVSVNVTPTGEGDVVVGDCFVKPEERRMPFAQYLDFCEASPPFPPHSTVPLK